VAEAAAGGSSLTATSRLPPAWRARKSFSPYLPAAAPQRSPSPASARCPATPPATRPVLLERAKEPTNGPV